MSTLISYIVSIGAGAIILYFGATKWGDVTFRFRDAAWASAIPHVVCGLLSLGLGRLFPDHVGLAFLVILVIQFFFQTTVLQFAVISANESLAPGKAFTLSGIVLLSDFLIASPIAHLATGTT